MLIIDARDSDSIDKALTSLELFHVVTPDRTYLNVNLERETFRRSAQEGATLLTVELSFVQIRTVVGRYSTTQNARAPSAATPIDQGKVAPATPPQSMLSKILSKVGA